MIDINIRALLAAGAVAAVPTLAGAQNLIVSASLPQVHFWVGQHMDPFADAMEERTDLTFTRFYAGELTQVGRELDALQGGAIDVADPLLAPYHEGAFPLSDVTQLPTVGTTSVTQTQAFLDLMASEEELVGGKTFYEYEIADKNIHAWPVATTAAYAISFANMQPESASDLNGLPLRAGSALHTIFLGELGSTPVTMPSSASYEALSRGTINGTILSIGDWKSYSLQDVLTYSITGVSVGHWGSYLAASDAAWNKMSEEQHAVWNETAREIALQNAESIDAQEDEVRSAAEADGAQFVDIADLPQDLQDAINSASANTWRTWVEQTEAAGHPAMATARLWADLTTQYGGELPDGVQEFLDAGM